MLSGTHDIGCVVRLRGLQVRPISAGLRAGMGGTLTLDWGAPSLRASRSVGGVVSLAAEAPHSLPPTDTAAGRGASSVLPSAPVVVIALLAAGWSVRRRHVQTR